jgi:hypothetical protein
MKRLRWLVVLFVALLATGWAASTWAFAHRGYPDAVYYHLLTMTINQQSYRIDEWIDPAAQRVRREQRWLGAQGWIVQSEDQQYSISSTGAIQIDAVETSTRRSLDDLFQGLLRGGFSGMGKRLMMHRAGDVARATIDGAPALCFATAFNSYFGTDGSLCVDARTYLPRTLTSITAEGLTEVTRYTSDRRLAPYALPADFFDPPHAQHSLWEQFSGWLQAHLPHR